MPQGYSLVGMGGMVVVCGEEMGLRSFSDLVVSFSGEAVSICHSLPNWAEDSQLNAPLLFIVPQKAGQILPGLEVLERVWPGSGDGRRRRLGPTQGLL